MDYDYETGEPKRGRDGLCIQMPRGKIQVRQVLRPQSLTGQYPTLNEFF